MKRQILIYLLVIICACIWSCTRNSDMNVLNQEQSEDILLSYVQFENNQYVFALTENEALELNIDEVFYREFIKHMNEINESLRKAESEGKEIIYVTNQDFSLVDNVLKDTVCTIDSRSYEDKTYISGTIVRDIFNTSHTVTNYCDQLTVSAVSTSDFWELRVAVSLEGTHVLTGTKGVRVDEVIYSSQRYLPVTWNVQLYKPGAIQSIDYVLRWTNTMNVHCYDDFGFPLPEGVQVSVQDNGSSFDLIINNITTQNYYLKLTKNQFMDILVQQDLRAGSTLKINLKMGATYTLDLLDAIDHATQISYVQIVADSRW